MNMHRPMPGLDAHLTHSPAESGDPAGEWLESEIASCTRPDSLLDLLDDLLCRYYAGKLADRNALANERLKEELTELAYKLVGEKPEALERLYEERKA